MKIRILMSLMFIALLLEQSNAQSILSLLDQDTWNFTIDQVAKLNKIPLHEMNPKLLAINKEATGDICADELLEFEVTDLNSDGISEVIARIDCSGRRLTRDLIVISRKATKYYCDIAPAYGQGITLRDSCEQSLLVGSCPLFELSMADPTVMFPFLYVWTGSKCKDVSAENCKYYKENFVPFLTNSIAQYNQMALPCSAEARERMILKILNLALAALKLNSMFSQPLVATDEMAKLDTLLSSLSPTLDGKAYLENSQRLRRIQIRKLLQKIKTQLNPKLSSNIT